MQHNMEIKGSASGTKVVPPGGPVATPPAAFTDNLRDFVAKLKTSANGPSGGRCHLLGLLSPGGVRGERDGHGDAFA